MSTLQDQFKPFIGRLVKDPERVSTDICDVTQELRKAASEAGLMLSFKKVAEPFDFNLITTPVLTLVVGITQDGVPADEAGWAWRIDSVEAD